jgi:hypothetical protein
LARVEEISQGIPGKAKSIDMLLLPVELAGLNFLEVAGRKDETRMLRNEFRKLWRIQSFTDFAKKNIRKVTVDPLGRVRWAEKKYWGQSEGCPPMIK